MRREWTIRTSPSDFQAEPIVPLTALFAVVQRDEVFVAALVMQLQPSVLQAPRWQLADPEREQRG